MADKNLKTEQILTNDNFYFGKIPKDWEWKTVDEIKKDKKALVSGPFGSNIGKQFFRLTGFPVIRGNNLKQDKFVDSGFVFVDDEKADELKNCIAVQDDIIFTAAGTIGQVGIIPKNGKYSKYIISNKQLRLRINPDVISPLFAFYWFSSKKMQGYLISNNVGSALPLLTLRELKSVPIPVPSIPEQNKITKILNDFYEKIQHLQKQNKVLEQIVQTIFKSWFVDFDGVTEFEDSELGQIPKGWEIKELFEIGENFADAPFGTKLKSVDYVENGIPVIQGRNIKNNRFDWNKKIYVSKIKFDSLNKHHCGVNDLVFPKIGTVGGVAIFPSVRGFEKCLLSTNMMKMSVNEDFATMEYVYWYFVQPEIKRYIQENSHGTIQKIFNFHNLKSFKIINPPLTLQKKFKKLVRPLMNLISLNHENVIEIELIKNSFLLKLMSGEIRV